MAPMLSGQASIFGVVSFVSKSLLGIERQKLKKFAASEPCLNIDISNVILIRQCIAVGKVQDLNCLAPLTASNMISISVLSYVFRLWLGSDIVQLFNLISFNPLKEAK